MRYHEQYTINGTVYLSLAEAQDDTGVSKFVINNRCASKLDKRSEWYKELK